LCVHGRRYLRSRADLPDEAVSHLRQCLDVLRRVPRVVERHAQFAHRHVQAVIEIDHAGGPQDFHQLVASNDRARVVRELEQDA
jgi:hypothetical protein